VIGTRSCSAESSSGPSTAPSARPRSTPPTKKWRSEAKAAADAIEHEYRRDRLGLLAYYGGWEADVINTAAIDRDVLAALEELDEEDEAPAQDEQENP
jgi:hypothetical protein